MAKPKKRAYSQYTREAVTLFGMLIRDSRLGRKLTMDEVAERAGVTRALVRRIERGEPGCSIGAAFEIASILGVRLFDADRDRMTANTAAQQRLMTLLPASARPTTKVIDDDF